MRTDFKKSFARDLRTRRKDQDFLTRIKNSIENVEQAETTANITNLKKLKGESKYFRIRSGNYRIGIKIEEDIVTFIRALHRKDIYQYFP